MMQVFPLRRGNLSIVKLNYIQMKKQDHKKSQPDPASKNEENNLPGYPEYPESEDIYSKSVEEEEIDPEDTSRKKEHFSDNTARRKSLDDLQNEEDLDIPGSELDDQQEAIGSEDEENNYYSLGSDRQSGLEENS
jgi:hypothetical protein